MKTIINSDEMFDAWGKTSEEIRRSSMGKYKNNQVINFEKAIPFYKGKSICSSKFNFQLDGNKCHNCNTLSFLFNDGNIKYNVPFIIQNGKYADKEIIVSKYSKSSNIGKYIIKNETKIIDDYLLSKMPLIDLCSNSFTNVFKIPKLINEDSDIYHYISVSVLLDYIFNKYSTETKIKNIYLSSYICDYIHVIKLNPNGGIGTFNKLILDIDTVKGIFIQLLFYFMYLNSMDAYFSHGSPSLEHLSFEKCSYEYNQNEKIIKSPVKLFIEPGKYTSLVYDDYNKSKFHILQKYDENILKEIKDIHLILNFIGEKSSSTKCKVGKSNNPCLSKYLEKRTFSFKLNENILKCIQNSGYSIFSTLDFYLFLISMLLEKEYYNIFISDPKMYKILSLLIFPHQFEMFNNKLKEHHTKNLPSFNNKQLTDFVIEIDLEFKCNIFSQVWNEFFV